MEKTIIKRLEESGVYIDRYWRQQELMCILECNSEELKAIMSELCKLEYVECVKRNDTVTDYRLTQTGYNNLMQK